MLDRYRLVRHGLSVFALGFLLVLATGTTDSPSSSSSSSSGPVSSSEKKAREVKIFNTGETVSVGYTSYAVWKSWWATKLSDNEFMDQKPDATFLFVKLTVRNNDKKARTIPPFKLIDENGAEYDTTSKAWAVKDAIGVLDDLNPGVQKDGIVVFDVPKTHTYKLKVSGGFWSTEDGLINLSPQ